MSNKPNFGMPKHHNVRFSMEQLEELKYITRAYLGTDGPAYVHAVKDFQEWLRIQADENMLEMGAKELSKPEAYSKIPPTRPPCSLCAGDPARIPGGCRCKECSIIGTQPWGG